MPKIARELGAKQVASLAKTEGRHAVGGCRGLQLRVTNTGAASWLLRVVLRTGRRVDIGIGAYDELSLEEARERGRQLRRQVRDGTYIDAASTRSKAQAQAKREDELARVTFGQDAEARHAALSSEFRNPKHAEQWIQSLRTYAAALWDKPSGDITRDDVLAVLKPQWTTKTETMTRVRQRIESVLAYSAVVGHRSTTEENPARWKGGLEMLLPKPGKIKRVKHHDALPHGDMPAFIQRLRAKSTQSARALEFAILTAARSGEVRLARWSEIDLQKKLWTVPAERMKAGREHRVPLSGAAVSLLGGLDKGEGDALVFPSVGGKPLSDMTLSKLLRDMSVPAVPHGFRSTFKDYCREVLAAKYTDEASELALAHVSDDKTRAAYARGELLEERRKLMAEWAEYLEAKE
jgi:integrase